MRGSDSTCLSQRSIGPQVRRYVDACVGGIRLNRRDPLDNCLIYPERVYGDIVTSQGEQFFGAKSQLNEHSQNEVVSIGYNTQKALTFLHAKKPIGHAFSLFRFKTITGVACRIRWNDLPYDGMVQYVAQVQEKFGHFRSACACDHMVVEKLLQFDLSDFDDRARAKFFID